MEFIILLICSFAPLLWFRNGEVILGHDSGFRLNFLDHLKNLSFSWHPNANFGIDWSLYHGFIPLQFWETVLSLLRGSLSSGQRITFVFWFLAIGASCLLFLRYFFPGQKFLLLRIIAPVYWMYNFYILNGWTIAERAKFSLYIALPLMIVIFFKTTRKEWSILRGGIYFGLLFFFMSGGGSLPIYGGILVTFALLVIYFFRLRTIKTIIVFGLCFFLFNAYWILPQIRLFTGNYQNAVSNRGGIEGLIAWEREISKYTSFGNVLRFQGFPDWYNNPEHPYANIYLNNPILIVLSLVPVFVVLMGVLFLRKKMDKKDRQILLFLGILGIVGLFFTMGSHPPFGVIYTYCMRYVPGFAIFRSSFYKFAPTVYLPIIIYFGYFVSIFFKNRSNKNFIGVVIACGIALYHFPYLTGNFFALKNGFSTRVTVPAYVYKMGNIIGTQTKPTDRILMVPPLDTGFINSPIDTYTWGFYSLDALPRILVNRSFLANDSSDDYVTRLLYTSLEQGDSNVFLRVAQAAGVSHVLWRRDVRLTKPWETTLLSEPVFQIVYEVGAWQLYSIRQPVQPMVSSATEISFVNDATVDDAYIVGSDISSPSGVLLRISGNESAITPKDRFIQAECFVCKENEYSKLVEAVTLPATKKMSFFRNQAKIVENGLPTEIDARLSAASTALSGKNITEYKSHMVRIIEILHSLKDRERDYYSNRVIAYIDGFAKYADKEDLRQKVAPLMWMADRTNYRFGVTVPVEGTYSVWVHSSDTYDQLMYLDGKKYTIGDQIALTSGYHRMLLTVKSMDNTNDRITSPVFLRQKTPDYIITNSPSVSFIQKNPSKYDVTVTSEIAPYVLVLNQKYDPNWGVLESGVKKDYVQYMANGYANAWIIPTTGSHTLSLLYRPQQYAFIGALISGVSIFLGLFYGIFYKR